MVQSPGGAHRDWQRAHPSSAQGAGPEPNPMKPKPSPEKIAIRRAQREDAPALLRLIIALAEFEKLPPPDAAAQKRLVADGFGERPRFECWLAFWEGGPEPVAYSFLFETYSSFLAL